MQPRRIWDWYLGLAVWLRVVIAVVLLVVVLGIVGSLTGGSEDEQAAAPTATPEAAALVRDQSTATPPPSPVPPASPEATPKPTPTPAPSLEEQIAQSIRDNRGFMPRASTDKMTVELTPTGLVIVKVQPTLANETDALTVASQTALIASRAIWTTYPDVQQIRVEVLNELTDANGAKSVQPITFIQVNRATAEPFQYDGLKTRVAADNKHLYCLADNYSIHPVAFREIRDRGCLVGAVR